MDSNKETICSLKNGNDLDGKIATKEGQSKWITGPEAREQVQLMRKECDAIMVGGETIRQDDSSLRVTLEKWDQPQRYIWSSKSDFSEKLKALKNDDGKSAIITKPQTAPEWNSLLTDMGKSEITCLLLEGGGELASNALQAGIVDKVSFFIAPKILGGRDSRTPVGGFSPSSLNEALELQNVSYSTYGKDLLIQGFLSEIWKS